MLVCIIFRRKVRYFVFLWERCKISPATAEGASDICSVRKGTYFSQRRIILSESEYFLRRKSFLIVNFEMGQKSNWTRTNETCRLASHKRAKMHEESRLYMPFAKFRLRSIINYVISSGQRPGVFRLTEPLWWQKVTWFFAAFCIRFVDYAVLIQLSKRLSLPGQATLDSNLTVAWFFEPITILC